MSINIKIDLQFLPEGGVFVADVENTVAFKAINEFGKPVDITAELVDENEKVLQTIKAYHQGMGKQRTPFNSFSCRRPRSLQRNKSNFFLGKVK